MPEAPNPKLRDIPPPEKPAGISALPYAELDVKTNFSFLRGASHPDELVYRAAELGYRAVAVTDFNSLAGVVRAHEAAKESGISLLIGSRLTFSNFYDLLVWAPDRAAYAKLCRLLTLGKRRAQKGECALELSDFLDHSEGLLAAVVWGCESGAQVSSPTFESQERARTPAPPNDVGSALADASLDIAPFGRVRQGGPYESSSPQFGEPTSIGINVGSASRTIFPHAAEKVRDELGNLFVEAASSPLFRPGEAAKTPLPQKVLKLDADPTRTSFAPSPGTPGEGWGEGSFPLTPKTIKTLTPALSRSTGRGSSNPCNHLHDALGQLKDALGDRLSLAASCSYGSDDATRLAQIARLSRRFNIPLLATNDVYYHDPSRRMLQDVLTCIRHGCTIREAGFRLFPNAERHLKSPEQMHRLFEDYPGAIRRGLEIAERCTFKLDELRYEYPDELAPAGKTTLQYLTDLTWAGAAGRYPAGVPEKVRRLVEHELALIGQLRFEHYFLTVYDVVTFARSRGILCQGRGSAANSAVCYCLGVTSVDPDRIDVLFERFISAARGEPPDIDVDFEHERREEVLQYLYNKYGRERAMTGVVITYRGRSAVRDVGKAMGLSLDMVDSLAGKLDWWHKGVVSDQQIRETGLDPADRTIGQTMALATELLGFPRHLSQHVGGMVMTRGPLCEMVPIENASMQDRTVIEWDKDDIDAIGILKVDVLALGMLTCISKALALVNEGNPGRNPKPEYPKSESNPNSECPNELCQNRVATNRSESEFHSDIRASDLIRISGIRVSDLPEDLLHRPLELHTVPPEDPEVYDMLSNADTVGVFQVESRAQMSMLPRLRPRCFYDIVIEVAIVRPGPIQGDMVHPYLRRRAGMEPVTFPSEALRQVLEKTLGVPLFQEQAMRVAMVGAGFTAEEADKLRRVMAAWRRTGAIEKFHAKIVDGMLKNGYTLQFAEQCFNQIKGFGEYGFPESHSASFALLVYVSSWLKRHHPAAFAAALLNSQPMGFYQPAQIVRDAKEHGVKVWPADVNHSEWDCTLEYAPQDSGVFLTPSPGTPGEGWGEGLASTPEKTLTLTLSRRTGRGDRKTESLAGSALLPENLMGARASSPAFSHQEVNASAKADPTQDGFGGAGVLARSSHSNAGEDARAPNKFPQWGAGGPALRLGFRELKGFRENHATDIVAARKKAGRFNSIPQFHRLTALPVSAIRILAEADAFGSLGLSRRDALWQAMKLKDEYYPLFDGVEFEESVVKLPKMPAGQEVMTDYATAGLSLKQHPVSLVRDELRKRKIITAAELAKLEHNRWVKVAGLVLIRQRPGTASGVVFETLEDETGIINLIVHPAIYDRYRPAARHAGLLQADGYIQRQGQIVHVLPKKLTDLSELLNGFQHASRDFH